MPPASLHLPYPAAEAALGNESQTSSEGTWSGDLPGLGVFLPGGEGEFVSAQQDLGGGGEKRERRKVDVFGLSRT